MKEYYSNHQEQVTKGELSEQRFKEQAIKRGYKVKKATLKDNKYRHIDYYITKDDKTVSVDVKTVGKFGYTAENKNNFGYTGSIGGEADYLCYVLELTSSRSYIFNFVNRERLLNYLIEKKIDPKVYSSSSDIISAYTRYTRDAYGWHDEFIVIPPQDLTPFIEIEWIE